MNKKNVFDNWTNLEGGIIVVVSVLYGFFMGYTYKLLIEGFYSIGGFLASDVISYIMFFLPPLIISYLMRKKYAVLITQCSIGVYAFISHLALYQSTDGAWTSLYLILTGIGIEAGQLIWKHKRYNFIAMFVEVAISFVLITILPTYLLMSSTSFSAELPQLLLGFIVSLPIILPLAIIIPKIIEKTGRELPFQLRMD